MSDAYVVKLEYHQTTSELRKKEKQNITHTPKEKGPECWQESVWDKGNKEKDEKFSKVNSGSPSLPTSYHLSIPLTPGH